MVAINKKMLLNPISFLNSNVFLNYLSTSRFFSIHRLARAYISSLYIFFFLLRSGVVHAWLPLILLYNWEENSFELLILLLLCLKCWVYKYVPSYSTPKVTFSFFSPWDSQWLWICRLQEVQWISVMGSSARMVALAMCWSQNSWEIPRVHSILRGQLVFIRPRSL